MNALAVFMLLILEVKYLVEVKCARFYSSLFAKIAFYGIEDKELSRKEIIKSLTRKLREHYFLLIHSPMPFNRKIMVAAFCINIKCLMIPIDVFKLIKGK